MKIGDLVRRHSCTRLGIVVDTSSTYDGLRFVKVQWAEEYGIFWTSPKAVEVVSENR